MKRQSYHFHIESLWDAVLTLSLAPELQLRLLKELGAPESIDELVLQFDDHFMLAKSAYENQQLTSEEYESLVQLDSYLNEISGPAHSTIWTREGLLDSPEWSRIRFLAQNALAMKQVASIRKQSKLSS